MNKYTREDGIKVTHIKGDELEGFFSFNKITENTYMIEVSKTDKYGDRCYHQEFFFTDRDDDAWERSLNRACMRLNQYIEDKSNEHE